jgi:hypothetical protein
VLEASTALRLADTAALATQDESGHRPALHAFLAQLRGTLLEAADAVDRAHFVHLLPRWSLVGPADSRVPGNGGG